MHESVANENYQHGDMERRRAEQKDKLLQLFSAVWVGRTNASNSVLHRKNYSEEERYSSQWRKKEYGNRGRPEDVGVRRHFGRGRRKCDRDDEQTDVCQNSEDGRTPRPCK
jgi:hypothetical protein